MTARGQAARDARLKMQRAQRAQRLAESAEAAKQARAQEQERETAREEAKSKAEQDRLQRSRPLTSQERCPVHGLMYFQKSEPKGCACEALR